MTSVSPVSSAFYTTSISFCDLTQIFSDASPVNPHATIRKKVSTNICRHDFEKVIYTGC